MDASVAGEGGLEGDEGGAEAAGADLVVTTVEMACLKTSCSRWPDSSMTANLSKLLMRPVNLTPLIRKTVTGSFSLRRWLRKTSCILCGCFSMDSLTFLNTLQVQGRSGKRRRSPLGQERRMDRRP